MVRHWFDARGPRVGGARPLLNGFGALLTGVSAVVVTATKFTEGAWLIVIALPLLVLGVRAGPPGLPPDRRPPGTRPDPRAATANRSLVIVPVGAVSRLTREAIAAALSLGDRVEAVHITHPDDDTDAFVSAWESWNPGVPLIRLYDKRRRLGDPLVEHLRGVREPQVFVLIAEVEPEHVWQRVLQNQRGAVLARAVRRHSDAVVCRLRFRVRPRERNA